MSGGIRKFDLATELSSLGQGLKNWDYLWQPEKAYDGIHYDANPGDTHLLGPYAMAASYTMESHNGFGFTLNFLTPKMVTEMKIYTRFTVISEWGIDYWDGSTWVRWGVFNTIDNANARSLVYAPRQVSLAAELQSMGQGLKNWDYIWNPSKAYDGIVYGSYPPDTHSFGPYAFAASYTNEDHNGFGFTLNFYNSIILTSVQIHDCMPPDYEAIAQWCLEYLDESTSTWVRWGAFDSAANRSGFVITLAIENTTIASHHWRVYVTGTSEVAANWYGDEVVVSCWGQQLDITVITLSLSNTSVMSDKWRVYATATDDEYSNWYGTELEVWGSDTALLNIHSFNWAAKGIRLCKVP